MRLIDADKAIEDIGDNIYTGSKIRRWLKSLPSAQLETNCSEIPNSSDTISRQLLGTNLAEVGTDCISRQQVIEPEAISKWKKEFREYVDSLDITRDDWKGIIEYIDELPSAEPDTTTHDSIPVETGKNDGDRTSGDCISRQAAIEHWRLIIDATSTDSGYNMGFVDGLEFCISHLSTMPSAQPDIIRCKDCKFYTAYDYTGKLMCKRIGKGMILPKPEDYCSYAERITDEKPD